MGWRSTIDKSTKFTSKKEALEVAGQHDYFEVDCASSWEIQVNEIIITETLSVKKVCEKPGPEPTVVAVQFNRSNQYIDVCAIGVSTTVAIEDFDSATLLSKFIIGLQGSDGDYYKHAAFGWTKV